MLRKRNMKHPIFVTLVILFPSADVSSQDVDTTHGRVTGLRMSVLGRMVNVYYGIPFAKPPIGELRFKHPKPVEPWRPSVKEARRMKPTCQQLDPGSFGMPLRATPKLISEDCLYLNIWTPTNVPAGTKLATMVWIYGGSFTTGSINMPLYDGKYLAAENDVIVISINYRVGAHGFLYLGPNTFPGNQGMMDQVVALQWIYDNTERFGGDRNSITIFGESAGAVSVGHHLISPLSRDYFTRGILQSGIPNVGWSADSAAVARNKTVNFARVTNCSVRSDIEMYNCIRQLTPEAVLVAQSQFQTTTIAFGPVVDGFFLPEDPSVLVEKGRVKKTDILLGVNKDEGTVFLAFIQPATFPLAENTITVSRNQFISTIQAFSEQQSTIMTKAVVAQYESTQVAAFRDSYQDIADDIFGDIFFKCPAVSLADVYSEWSRVYLYSFEHRIASFPVASWIGVAHSFDLEVVFGHALGDVLTATIDEKELTRRVMAYWTNFAKTGHTTVAVKRSIKNPVPVRSTHYDCYISQRQRVEQGMRKQECVFVNTLLPLILKNRQNPVQGSSQPPRCSQLRCLRRSRCHLGYEMVNACRICECRRRRCPQINCRPCPIGYHKRAGCPICKCKNQRLPLGKLF